MSLSSQHTSVWFERYAVSITLAISLLLRWTLVFRGGQFYFSDEGRYEISRSFVDRAASGDAAGAFSQLFASPEHLGFKIIGILPALVEQVTRESIVLPTLFFSLFSVLNLYVIYLISKRAGATEKESLVALIFAVSSMSLLYFSRHLMPYDPALTFGLLALYIALTDKPDFKSSPACGALAFLCFITYNGYWSLAVLAMSVNVLRGNTKLISFIQKGLLTAFGFVLPAVLLIYAAYFSGVDLLKEYRAFAATVRQGSFDEGWSLPFEYFWHAEHLVIVAFASLSIYVMFISRGQHKSRFLWAASILFIYLCLAIPSVFMHSFVVYGRLARQIMPFLALLSAAGFAQMEVAFSSNRRVVQLLLAAILVQAAWNYIDSYRLSYPREFSAKAQAAYPEFAFSEKRLIFGAPALCQNNGYVAEYVKRFDSPPDSNPPVQGVILLSAPHPDNFLPYQYEGYTYEQRQYLRELNPGMRLYKADDEFMSESNPIWKTMKSCVVGDD